MADSDLIATVLVNGEFYSDWTSVSVSRVFGNPVSEFTLICAEPFDGATMWPALKLKPGDACRVFLAGIQVINGYIIGRKPGYDANQHQLAVQGQSLTCDVVDSSVKPDQPQFRGYSLESAIKGVLRDFPVDVRIENPPSGSDRNFQDLAPQPGEPIWDFLERISRVRGVIWCDDKDGNLVGRQLKRDAAPVAELVEGQNIVAASAAMIDKNVFARVIAVGQNRGSDEARGSAISDVAAQATNPTARPWRTMVVHAEQPGDKKDMQTRAEFEVAKQIYTSVDCVIDVQGWKRPDGQLWDVCENVTVQSPMLFPTDNGQMNLAINAVTFSQNANGSRTSLQLCLPNALSINPSPGVNSAPDILNPPSGEASPL